MTDYYYDDVTGKPFRVVPYKDLVKDDIVKNEIDIDYYKTVIETQNDPEILKGELTDLVGEVEKFFRNKGKYVNNFIIFRRNDANLQ